MIKRFLCILFFATLLAVALCISALAMNTGFETEPVDTETRSRVAQNMEISVFCEEPQKKRPIDCFAVRDDGVFAVGRYGILEEYVGVYDSLGKFLYGFSMRLSGNFLLEWDTDSQNLIIYLIRSDLVVLIDESGAILEMSSVLSTSENVSYSNALSKHRKQANDRSYRMAMSNPLEFFSFSFSQIRVTDGDGNVSVLYDASASATKQGLTIIIVVSLFVGGVTLVVIKEFKRLQLERMLQKRFEKKTTQSPTQT